MSEKPPQHNLENRELDKNLIRVIDHTVSIREVPTAFGLGRSFNIPQNEAQNLIDQMKRMNVISDSGNEVLWNKNNFNEWKEGTPKKTEQKSEKNQFLKEAEEARLRKDQEEKELLELKHVQRYTQAAKARVQEALRDGRPVDPELLADYPDLEAQYRKKIDVEQETTTPTTSKQLPVSKIETGTPKILSQKEIDKLLVATSKETPADSAESQEPQPQKKQTTEEVISEPIETKKTNAEISDEDPRLVESIKTILELKVAAPYLLEEKLKLSQLEADTMIAKMTQMGIIGPWDGKERPILRTKKQLAEFSKSNPEAREATETQPDFTEVLKNEKLQQFAGLTAAFYRKKGTVLPLEKFTETLKQTNLSEDVDNLIEKALQAGLIIKEDENIKINFDDQKLQTAEKTSADKNAEKLNPIDDDVEKILKEEIDQLEKNSIRKTDTAEVISKLEPEPLTPEFIKDLNEEEQNKRALEIAEKLGLDKRMLYILIAKGGNQSYGDSELSKQLRNIGIKNESAFKDSFYRQNNIPPVSDHTFHERWIEGNQKKYESILAQFNKPRYESLKDSEDPIYGYLKSKGIDPDEFEIAYKITYVSDQGEKTKTVSNYHNLRNALRELPLGAEFHFTANEKLDEFKNPKGKYHQFESELDRIIKDIYQEELIDTFEEKVISGEIKLKTNAVETITPPPVPEVIAEPPQPLPITEIIETTTSPEKFELDEDFVKAIETIIKYQAIDLRNIEHELPGIDKKEIKKYLERMAEIGVISGTTKESKINWTK